VRGRKEKKAKTETLGAVACDRSSKNYDQGKKKPSAKK